MVINMKNSPCIASLAMTLSLAFISMSAQASDALSFHWRLDGMGGALAGGSVDKGENAEDWWLNKSDPFLEGANYDESYNYSASTLTLPSGLSGFTWSATGLPEWASIDTATGEITGTPESGDTSSSFYLQAMRDGVTKEALYTIPVGENPSPWSLDDSEDALPEAFYNEDYSYSLTDLVTPSGLSGFDWSAENMPEWLHLDKATGELTGTPSTESDENTDIQISVTREGISAEQSYTIHVGENISKFTDIDIFKNHTCGITTEGAAKCWGRNNRGQLGNGTLEDSNIPVQVTGLDHGVKSIAVGQQHSCAITASDTVKCWGASANGSLGNNRSSDSPVPVDVKTDKRFSKITLGANYSCGITTAGAALCWGSNTHGQLGVDDTGQETSPAQVDGMRSGVTDIEALSNVTCAVQDNKAYCWGYNYHYNVGKSYRENEDFFSPQLISSGVKEIESHCLVTTSGAVKCWGHNRESSPLGTGTYENLASPTQVVGLGSGVKSLAEGYSQRCAIMESNAVKCWGRNADGQLGDGTTTTRLTPTTIMNLSGATYISLGEDSGCALFADGGAKCWGDNYAGKLGNGTSDNSLVPVSVVSGG